MDEVEMHNDFGLLKTRFSKINEIHIRERLISEMRNNLLIRNEGKDMIILFPGNEWINLRECDIEGLYAADMTLFHDRFNK